MTDSCRCSGRTQSAMSGPGLLLLRVPEEEGSGVAEEEEEDEDSDAFTVHLRHRSSPTPRRRDRSRDEADEPPAGGRRKVLFADACGRELEHWFRYGPFDETPSPEEKPEAVCWLLPDFQVPAEPWLLLQRVREQGVEVEAVRPVEGEPLSVRGLARVLNVSFRKTVHARATLDGWATHYDHPAAYVESAPDGETDLFAFVLSYPRLYARPGARLHFAVRYEAGDDPARSAVRWANNGGRDYALVCAATPAGEGERRRGSAGSAPPALERRGCLKPPSLRPRG
ncbi:protein phosphatase 1 regulatory subunit 3A-like [Narcine bancroftii]|uniref:protein phosphatase 1 regulatory subunit 3A-like n=1 Tax=Narcine bancroftii TaxID=1343680 RepID=UPI003831C157